MSHRFTESIDPSELSRDSDVEFADGSDGRVYDHPLLAHPVPSSTTVTDTRVDPEKEARIEGWKAKYDGSDEDSLPHHEDQSRYYKKRGTLVHYALANAVTDIEMGEEERDAQENLKGWTYDGEDAHEQCLKDIDWSLKQWQDCRSEGHVSLDGGGCSMRGVVPEWRTVCAEYDEPLVAVDEVLGCEQYVLDREWGYAGQYDLAYEQPDGVRVLADFKTSSGIYLDYKLQLALYDVAMQRAVDRWQVIRIDPDEKVVVVEDDRDWDRSKQGLRNEALSLVERTHVSRLPDFSDDEDE